MFSYTNYEEARKGLEESKAHYTQMAVNESVPVNLAFRVGLHDDRYFSNDCWEVSRLQHFAPVEFIDRDQVFWLTYSNDDLKFHNSGIEDWTKNPYYSTGK